MAADERARAAAQALGDLAELDPDLVAGEQPGLGRLGQRHAGAHEQRLDARDGGLHRLGDLLVGERIHLPQQQRGALRLRQVLDVVDEQPELLAAVHLVSGRSRPCSERCTSIESTRDGLDAAQMVEAAVAGDPVQPRAHVDRTVVGEDRVVGGGEDLLQHVLRVLA